MKHFLVRPPGQDMQNFRQRRVLVDSVNYKWCYPNPYKKVNKNNWNSSKVNDNEIVYLKYFICWWTSLKRSWNLCMKSTSSLFPSANFSKQRRTYIRKLRMAVNAVLNFSISMITQIYIQFDVEFFYNFWINSMNLLLLQLFPNKHCTKGGHQ